MAKSTIYPLAIEPITYSTIKKIAKEIGSTNAMVIRQALVMGLESIKNKTVKLFENNKDISAGIPKRSKISYLTGPISDFEIDTPAFESLENETSLI